MATNTVTYMVGAVDIVQRFLPPGTERRIALCGAIWSMGQCSSFVRNRELFAREPFKITTDGPFVDEWRTLFSAWRSEACDSNGFSACKMIAPPSRWTWRIEAAFATQPITLITNAPDRRFRVIDGGKK
ncbi:MAG: hypothetical protein P8Y71_11710 [Pseudolabrys sp.]|jgi:hypothetical protein